LPRDSRDNTWIPMERSSLETRKSLPGLLNDWLKFSYCVGNWLQTKKK
jgi:hypothetical protein